MSFESKEISVADSKPVFLYKFSTPNGSYCINNSGKTMHHDGKDYVPAVVKHSVIIASDGADSKTQLNIDLSANNPFALAFLNADQQEITTIDVFGKQHNDETEETELAWKGEVVGVKPSDKKVVLSCDSIISRFKQNIVFDRFQVSCRYAVYQTGCNLNRDNFANQVTLLSVSGVQLTVQYPLDGEGEPIVPADGYFGSGLIKSPAGNLYHIAQHTGGTLILLDSAENLADELQAAVELEETLIVTLYPGCTKSMKVCKERFNNLNNYGGFPWTPGQNNNPFGGSPID